MAKNRFVWKSLRESMWKDCDFVVEKFVESKKFDCSGCSVLWKRVRFCEKLFGFSGKSRGSWGKDLQREFGKEIMKTTISTYPTITTTNLLKEGY